MNKKSYNITIGLGIILLGVLLLGIDRIFVAADTGGYFDTVTVVTTIAILVVLIGVIWLFKSTLQ